MEDQGLGKQELIELLKMADANHLFFITRRFSILALLLPLATSVLTGAYALLPGLLRLAACAMGLALSVFLYALASRQWVASNVCLHAANDLAKRIDAACDLHQRLIDSWKSALPVTKCFLDIVVRKISPNQHRWLQGFTVVLFLYWIALVAIAICWR